MPWWKWTPWWSLTEAGSLPGEQPLHSLKGVGPKVAEKLARIGIGQVRDLLFHLPSRYEDRTRIHPMGTLRIGQRVMVQGEVRSASLVRARRSMFVWVVSDGTGSLTMRMFNFYPNQVQRLKRGVQLRCFGEVRPGQRGLEMIHPEYRECDPETPLEPSLTPFYPTTEGVNQALWRKLTDQVLAGLDDLAEELLPRSVLDQLGLPTLADALAYVHRPPPDARLDQLSQGEHPCQQRLAFEELLAHRLSLRRRRQQIRQLEAPPLTSEESRLPAFLDALPFELTGAQQRSFDEIDHDLAASQPTLRLLQGDVGAGKTVVAAAAALRAIDAGFQAAIAAPTEILAEQHYHTLRGWLAPLGVEVAWLSGKVRGKERTETLERISSSAQLIVGTHALMQAGVEYRSLGLVIVDEQHRFGVHQRMALRNKGATGEFAPHQLIMTATPIPRTLAMTDFADLDVSVIDELPPNRLPVTTVAVSNGRRQEVIDRVRASCTDGRQAYWVCTLIEESESLRAEPAQEIAATLEQQLPELVVALLHGRMKPAEKEQVMAGFKDGQSQLLVATTVIEVGVDVPNASLMVIENAERLGLSQLHQLRGRVGRGADAATCVLLFQSPLSDTARQRLEVMRETNDGFVIARKDLDLRGPGEVLGTRQTGESQFRIADRARDRGLMDDVARHADEILRQEPDLALRLVRRWAGAASEYAEV